MGPIKTKKFSDIVKHTTANESNNGDFSDIYHKEHIYTKLSDIFINILINTKIKKDLFKENILSIQHIRNRLNQLRSNFNYLYSKIIPDATFTAIHIFLFKQREILSGIYQNMILSLESKYRNPFGYFCSF